MRVYNFSSIQRFFFFFSSRRRHTRLQGDWSSDVCSSDLAATGVVPLSVALPGLLPSATATAPVNPVATFPKASSARTFTAGVIWRFATVVPGSVPNASWVATPAVILKLLLVAVFRPVAVAVSAQPVPVLSSVRGEKLATPFTAATVV